MPDAMAGFHDRKTGLVSLEDGKICYTLGDQEAHGAEGIAKTKVGAKKAARRAVKKIVKARAHLAQKSEVLTVDDLSV